MRETSKSYLEQSESIGPIRSFISRVLFLLSLALMGTGLFVLAPVARYHLQQREMNAIMRNVQEVRYIHARRSSDYYSYDVYSQYDSKGQLARVRLNLHSSRYPSPRVVFWQPDRASIWLKDEGLFYDVEAADVESILARYSVDFIGEVRQIADAMAAGKLKWERSFGEIETGLRGDEYATRISFDPKSKLPTSLTRYGYGSFSFPRRFQIVKCDSGEPPADIFDFELPSEVRRVRWGESIDELVMGHFSR